ncbi:MAG: tryptophanase [Saprospiraceae bacterium]|nr:tryptophanase [Saprospiraceae bacterium]MBK7809706.1 tryptophanase [Saprospiraceae bacterium]MBK9632184.1 tryptophanase [Saprospiraceae bacterium]
MEYIFKTLAEPFRIKMVEPIKGTTLAHRKEALHIAGNNPFLLDSKDVYIDLLTDSGTGAMSQKQWAGMIMADESYAGARSWLKLEQVVKDLTGMPYVLPTHQGRAAERILYGILGGPDKVFLSNTHFDTTRANIEYTGATALDLMPDDLTEQTLFIPFKGNMDLRKLEYQLANQANKQVAAVILTVTNNSSGGQPVSMENAKAVRVLCNRFGVMMVLDGCRIAENAYFIHHREEGYQHKSYRDIAHEMLSLADAFIMSAKKDGMVNMGGLLCMKDQELSLKCINQLIISEGFTTYGGLSGRDMEAMAIGLQEVFDEDYLHYRIRSTAYLGEKLKEMGVPVVWPIGGHAVYIDAARLFPNIPIDEYPGQVLVCELYKIGGIRCVEVGSMMFGKYDTNGQLIPAAQELVRLAIPRRVYTQSHIDFVLEAFDYILKMRDNTSGYQIVYEPPFLRHFTTRLKKL